MQSLVEGEIISISGDVVSNRFRRSEVSTVNMAGIAKSQFKIPVPRDTRSSLERVKSASMEIWVE